ncbi:sugar transferase [Virgibacillus kimchii]
MPEKKKTANKKEYRVLKRMMDILLGIMLVIILLPVFFSISIVIFKREGRPIFQREPSINRKNIPFTLWQFRTLSNPSRLITAFPPYMYPRRQSLRNSGRDSFRMVTATGRWLKKYKLDQLPLLFHVIKGDVSFFGKRSEPSSHIDPASWQANLVRETPSEFTEQ